MALSEVSAPTKPSIKYAENPSEETHATSKPSFVPPVYEITLDNYIISDG
jgi:hypothetical protein